MVVGPHNLLLEPYTTAWRHSGKGRLLRRKKERSLSRQIFFVCPGYPKKEIKGFIIVNIIRCRPQSHATVDFSCQLVKVSDSIRKQLLHTFTTKKTTINLLHHTKQRNVPSAAAATNIVHTPSNIYYVVGGKLFTSSAARRSCSSMSLKMIIRWIAAKYNSVFTWPPKDNLACQDHKYGHNTTMF